MKRFACYAIICIGLLSGCGMIELESKDEPCKKETGENGDEIDIGKTVFMSAVAFKEGYDWRNDNQDEGGDEKLLLIAGDKIVAEIESDGADDIHYIVKGALYQCPCADGQTHILKNGTEILTWPKEETVCDLALDGNELLCLCCAASGEGGYVCLRCDGNEVRHYEGCFPTSEFFEDQGQLLFGIGGSLCGYAGVDCEYVNKLSADISFDRMYMYRANGLPWIWWTSGGVSYAGNKENFTLATDPGRILGILYGGSGVYVEKSTLDNYMILKEKSFSEVCSSHEFFSRVKSTIEGDDIYALGTRRNGSWAIFHDGCLEELPLDCTPVSGAGMTLRYGRLMFPLIMNDGTAAVWDNGKVVRLGLNGYVDHICLGRGSSKKFWMSE